MSLLLLLKTTETTGPPPASNPRVAMVVDDIAGPSPTANDVILRDALVAAGMTVTYLSEAAAPPADTTNYDVVVHTESGSSTGTAAINAYPTMAVPLVYLETSWQAVGFGSAAATNPTSTTQYDIIDNAHPITTGKPDPLTWRTGASGNYGVATSGLPAGVTTLATPVGNATHATLAVAESGATLTSGTAPARRVVSGLGVGSAPASLTADGLALFVSAVTWAANLPTGPTTVNAAVAMTATSTLTSDGTVSQPGVGATAMTAASTLTVGAQSTRSAAVAMTATSTLAAQPVVPLPAKFGDGNHVEAESHSYGPAVVDSNGNLYRVTESQLASAAGFQNQPRMMKSTDGGMTWLEMDGNNRPGRDTGSIGDLESGWTTYDTVRKQITFTWQRSYVVWSGFRTSDHPTNPDTWVSNTRENMAALTGSPQYASHTSPTDQSYEWVFYNNSTTKPSYRSRTGSGLYGTQADVDSAGQHPAAILDSANVSHILYTKSSQLHYKKLTSAGTLDGASTRVDSGGITTTPIAHAAPQAWVNGGTTYVGALFANSSNILKFVLLTNGVAGSEETVSSSAVVVDPGLTGNQGAVASLAVDPTNGTMYAVWSQADNGDVMYASRPIGGAWSAPATQQNPAFTPAWVYAKVNTFPTSRRVLSIVYVQEVNDDLSDVWYDERTLSSGVTTVSAAVAMTAASTLTTAAVRTSNPAVALTAASTLTTAAVRTSNPTVAMTAASTLTTAAVREAPAAAALTATSTLTTAAVRTSNAAVALVATSTLTTAAFREFFASVAMTASGTLTTAAVRTSVAAASLTATSTLTTAAVRERPAAVAMTATSTLTTAAVREVPAAVAMTGVSTLTVAATTSGSAAAAAALTATSTLTTGATREQFATVPLTATSTLTTAAVRVVPAVVAMAATSTLTTAAVRTSLPAVAMTAASTLVAATVTTRNATVALTATSVLAVAGVVTENAAVAMTGVSTLTTAAVRVVVPAVAFAGTSTLTTAGVRERPAAVAMTAEHSMDLLADSTGQKSGAVDFVASQTTTVGAVRVRPAAVAMTATHTTTVAAVRAVPGAVALVASQTTTVGAVRIRPAAVALTASGILTAGVIGAVPAAAALSALSVLTTSAVRERPALTDLTAVSTLVVGAVLVRPVLVAMEAAATLEVTGVRARNSAVSMTSVASLVVYATIVGLNDLSDMVWAVMRANTTRAMFRENGEADMRPNWTRALMQETP